MYIGRFAPTPSGPLHFGSIIAALGSYLDARKHKGLWLVRIDDLDTPRVRPGASGSIIKTLELLGLHWDGDIQYQSKRHEAYQNALDLLHSKRLLYRCICTRRLTKGRPYPGTCRKRVQDSDSKHALRLMVGSYTSWFEDRLLGKITANLSQTCGDFIIRRSDNHFAYHLASVIDDHWQQVTDIVRGGDLIDATLCQIYLQSCLDLPRPSYCHLPVATDISGNKISKSGRGHDVSTLSSPGTILLSVLEFLGHSPDRHMVDGSVEEILQWGVSNWQIAKLPRTREIKVEAALFNQAVAVHS